MYPFELRRFACALLSTSILFGAANAQSGTPSVLQINGDVHFGVILTTIPNPSTPNTPAMIEVERGKLTLRNDLTFGITSATHSVQANRQTATGSSTDGGTYKVAPDAKLVLDFMPSAPGADTSELFIDHDASMVVGARDVADIESWLAIGVRSSTGRSNSDATGQYAVVRKFIAFEQSGLVSGVSSGTMAMNGAGGWALVGSEESVSATGGVSILPVSDSGTYTVAANGVFSISGSEIGAISPNGDVFFMVEFAPGSTQVALTVGVRIGSSYNLGMLAGGWGIAGHELELGTQLFQPAVHTEVGTVAVNTSPATFMATTVEAESNPLQATVQQSTSMGTVSINAGGVAGFTESGGPGTLNVAVSPTGEAFVGTEFIGASNLWLGVRICGGSAAYGTATVGTGGVAPAAGMREFPTLGNSTFALRVVDGVGGGAVAMVVAAAPSAGIPLLGGVIWFDPTQISLALTLGLSGTPGVAGAGDAQLPLPVPNLSALAGLSLYLQGLILDTGAPAGLAMTDGFRMRICR